jgi:hypothetical protein
MGEARRRGTREQRMQQFADRKVKEAIAGGCEGESTKKPRLFIEDEHGNRTEIQNVQQYTAAALQFGMDMVDGKRDEDGNLVVEVINTKESTS